MFTPSSSSVPVVSSPSAAAVGKPFVSVSRLTPSIGPVSTCLAPLSARNVGYGTGASPKSLEIDVVELLVEVLVVVVLEVVDVEVVVVLVVDVMAT